MIMGPSSISLKRVPDMEICFLQHRVFYQLGKCRLQLEVVCKVIKVVSKVLMKDLKKVG